MSIQTAPLDLIVEYSAGEHRFFDELVRFVICYASVGQSFELHKSGIAKPFNVGEVIVIEGKRGLSNLELHFYPRPLFDKLLSASKSPPRFLRAIKRTINPEPPNHPIKVTKAQAIMARLIGDAFVSYYERHSEQAEIKWGKYRDGQWHQVWKFGRALRNACAHNGCIHIKNEKETVEWGGLEYSHRDNNKKVLFDQITGVELILLMEDMDRLL